MLNTIQHNAGEGAAAQDVRGVGGFSGNHMKPVIDALTIGLRRTLARQHGWNESLNPREGLLGVALGDQAGISADAPANGAKETA